MTGPPLSYSMDFIAGGLVGMIGGLAAAVVLVRLRVVGAARARRRLACDALAAARERRLARPQHRRSAQRAARRRLRVPPGRRSAGQQGAAAVRARRLDDRSLRRPAHAASPAPVRGDAAARAAARLEPAARHRPPTSSSSGPWRRRPPAAASASARSSSTRSARSARRSSRLAGSTGRSTAPSAPVAGGPASGAGDGARRRARVGTHDRPRGLPAREIRFRDVTLRLSRRRHGARRLRPHDSRRLIARHRRPERRGQDDARQAAVPAVRPAAAARSRSTASTCATSISPSWRSRLAAVFQDFIRLELPLRDNVAPAGAPDEVVRRRAAGGGRRAARATGHDLARGYEGGTDLSGGQWQRVALARALCAVKMGAGVVAARRADGAARCARRGRDLRAHPGRDAALHDDPHLAPLLDRAPRRSDLRAREGQSRRARHARRADGA